MKPTQGPSLITATRPSTVGSTTRRLALVVATSGVAVTVAVTALTAGALTRTETLSDVERIATPSGLETTPRPVPTTSRPAPTTSRPDAPTSRPVPPTSQPAATSARPPKPAPGNPALTALWFMREQIGERVTETGEGYAWTGSKLVSQAYRHAGIDLPQLADPYGYYQHGEHIPWAERQPGDLVVYMDHTGEKRRVGAISENINKWIIARPAEQVVKETEVYTALVGSVVIRVKKK